MGYWYTRPNLLDLKHYLVRCLKTVKDPKMNPKLYIQMATQFLGPKQFKAWVEQNADKYASVTMNLGWHLWVPI